jgi:hypothetical protein
VIGLYLDPPDKALVLCCDEKSQCQALERTQPGLPLGIGHIRTKTHDYVRARHIDLVRRAQLSRKQADHPPGGASSSSGMARLSQADRPAEPG